MKRYAVDKVLLTETPEIEMGDKIYKVDNRLSVFKGLGTQMKSKAKDETEYDVIIRVALGKKALAEITALDIPYPALESLTMNILAAMQGISVEEATHRFQSQPGQ